MNRDIMILPDTHVPDHDPAAMDAFLTALVALRPHELVIIGDFIDCKAPARWSKATAEEYAGTLVGEIEAGKAMLARIRNNFDGPISFIEGNHEARIRNYINKYAPAIAGLVPSLPKLLEFDEFAVTFQDQPYMIAPGVSAIHGNLLSSTLSSAGQSAFKERARHGTSIVQGHTHRLGIGWDKQEKARFWMECGHLVDTAKMDYLAFAGQANWQQGFGVVHVRDEKVFPTCHAIHSGSSAYTVSAA